MPKLDLTAAKRITVASGEVSRLKGVGFEWVKPVADLRAQVIAALYSGGRRGFLLDFSDTSTLFQDDAESSPVTAAAQQIAVARDISGNGLHFRQSSSSARPLYQEQSGVGYARGDGLDDFMETAATNSLLTNADGMMFFAVARRPGAKLRRNVVSQWNAGAGKRVWADNPTLDSAAVSVDYMFTVQTPDSFSVSRLAIIPDDGSSGWYTTVGAWAGAGTPSRVRINAGSFVSADPRPSVAIVSEKVALLGTPASSLFSQNDVALVGAVDRDQSTDAEILALVQQLLDARTPA